MATNWVFKHAIQKPGVGPALPVSLPMVFEGFGLAELLEIGSFGHILGAGMILGLGNAGLLLTVIQSLVAIEFWTTNFC